MTQKYSCLTFETMPYCRCFTCFTLKSHSLCLHKIAYKLCRTAGKRGPGTAGKRGRYTPVILNKKLSN